MNKISDPVVFDAILKKLEGKIAWTVFYVPADLVEQLGGTTGGGRVAVQGCVDNHAFRGTLLPSRNGHYLVYNAQLRDACGKSLDDGVHVELKPDTSERPVELPDYIAAVLKQNAAAHKAFESLPAYRRREEITRITSAKQEATRQRRIAQLLRMLSAAKAR